jgi:hypothetical protein
MSTVQAFHRTARAAETPFRDISVPPGPPISDFPEVRSPCERHREPGPATSSKEQHDILRDHHRADRRRPEGEITISAVRKWTLSPDGDTLTVELTSRSPQGEMKSTRVFTRQKAPAE